MGSQTGGEGELGLLTLGPLQGGAGARTEAADVLQLGGADHLDQALRQRPVQVAARRLSGRTHRHTAVALDERPVEPLAPPQIWFVAAF